MVVNSGFWRGRTVFVTGHTGFKGAWLCLWLQQLGAQVTGYALQPPTKPNLFEAANVAAGMISILGDIQKLRPLNKAMTDARPEVVIHMAAQPLVRYSYKNPVETYTTNVLGTVHLLESVRKIPSVKAVVNVTSDKCYENREWTRPYSEDDALGGYDPYSSSKACAELVSAGYRRSFGLSLATARAGNVIGGGDWAVDRLIPDLIRAIENRKTVIIRNPQSTRPWQHVFEPLSGYLTLAQLLHDQGASFSEAWNFGPLGGDAQTVISLVQKVKQLSGGSLSYSVESAPGDQHEAASLRLDSSKAHTRLNWKSRLSLDKALQMTMNWYNAYFSQKSDMRELSLAQLDEYERLPVL